jgi:cyclic-di-AMP phosphodiesterase PgpH
LYASKIVLVPLQKKVIDSLSKNNIAYTPIYKYNPDVLPAKIKSFNEDFEQALSLAKKDNSFPDVAKFSKIYLQYGEQLLGKIYERGVVEQKIVAAKIKISRGDLATEIASNKVLTPISANNFISDSLPFSPLREPEFLYNVLEKKIVSNLVFDEKQNEAERQKIVQILENHRDTIKVGDLIVKKGKKITPAIYHKLNAMKDQNSVAKLGDYIPIRFLIFMLFTVFCFFVLTTHTALYHQKYLLKEKTWLYVLAFIVALNVLHYFVINQSNLHPLLTPFLVLPMFFRNNLQVHYITIAHLISVIVASQITPMPFPFVVATLMSGFFMLYVQYFEGKSFGKIGLTLSSLSILAFVFYSLSFQQNIVFDPFNILIFIALHGILVLAALFVKRA